MLLEWVVVLVAVSAVCLKTVDSGGSCTFTEGDCTYNIHLSYQGDCENDSGEDSKSSVDISQNDPAEKKFDVQKNLKTVKGEHEIRIRKLENQILKLEATTVGKSRQHRARNTEINSVENGYLSNKIDLKTDSDISETQLLSDLQTEFNALRETLKKKNEEIYSMKRKLNATEAELTKTQSKLFQSTRKLITAEDTLGQVNYERHVLKNQVKNKQERLEYTEAKLNKTATEKHELQDKFFIIVRSESTTTEELYLYKIKLNETLKKFDNLHKKHRDLRIRHHRTRFELRVRERELMECYRAKTSTFCGFEDKELCGFTQENKTDFFNWDRAKGTTPSSSTGPTGDNTCKSEHGHFMYIEASAKGKGNNAVMYSPRYRGLSKQCVEFYYHMHGRHVGILNVYTKTPSDELLSVWRAFGNQGNFWIAARLQVPEELARASYQMAFEGIAQNGYQGDIAIDDIRVTDGNCPVEARVQTVPIVLSGLKGNLTSFDSIIRKRRKHRNKKQQKTAQPG